VRHNSSTGGGKHTHYDKGIARPAALGVGALRHDYGCSTRVVRVGRVCKQSPVSIGGSSSWQFALSAGEAGATGRRLAATLKGGSRGRRYLKQADRSAVKQSGNVVCGRGVGILLDPVVVSCLYLVWVVGQQGRRLASDVHRGSIGDLGLMR
jgi:hypothetical protein